MKLLLLNAAVMEPNFLSETVKKFASKTLTFKSIVRSVVFHFSTTIH